MYGHVGKPALRFVLLATISGLFMAFPAANRTYGDVQTSSPYKRI